MNDDARWSEFPHSDQLDSAVRAVLSAPAPEDAIERVSQLARQLLATPPATQHMPLAVRRWRPSRTLVGGLIAATVLAIIVGAVLNLDRSGSRAFAQMVERVNEAGTVQFYSYADLGWQSDSGQTYMRGNQTRFENSDGAVVTIWDVDNRQLLILNVKLKTFQLMHFDDEKARELANPIDRFRLIRSDDARLVGDEMLDGRLMRTYQLDRADILGVGRDDLETKVWVDLKTNLPAKIVVRDPDPTHQLEFRFEDFVWDAPLDPQLFSLEVPRDFEDVMAPPNGAVPMQAVKAAPFRAGESVGQEATSP